MNKSIKNAALINIIGQYTGIIINIIFSAILSRILTPQEFGVVAVILVFTTFFSILSNMGLGSAIVQNRTISNEDYNSLFSLTIIIGLIVSILFIVLAYPISLIYQNSAYISIGILLSISLFFNTVNIVPASLLMKNHKFKVNSYRTISIGIVTSSITIFLAINGFSYYSIVIHSIIVSILTFTWNFFSSNIVFGFKVSKESIDKIKDFSKYLYAFSLINYFARNLDNLLIGRFLGDTQLGYYNRSYQLMLFPIQNLTHAITPVLHPILSEYQNDKKIIYDKYLTVLKLLSIIGVFVTVFSYFNSKEIVLILYGNQWEGSIKSFQWLSISIWFQMLTSSTGSLFQSIGDTKLLMKTGILTTTIIVLGIILGIIAKNIDIIALTVSLSYIIVFIFTFISLIKFGFNYSFINFIKQFRVDLVNISVVFIFKHNFYNFIIIDNLILSTISKFMSISILYIFLLIITKQFRYVYLILPSLKKKGN